MASPEKFRRRNRRDSMVASWLLRPYLIHKLPPESRTWDARTGLLRESLVGKDLWLPYGDGQKITFSTAEGADLIAYDHRRKREIPDSHPYKKGSLLIVEFPELQDTDPQKLTPTGYADTFNINTLFALNKLPIDEVVKKGYLKEKTYHDVFTAQGIDQHHPELLEEIGERVIFEVTPKGNGLVYLLNITGDHKIKKAEQKTRVRVPGIIPQPI